MQRSSLMRASSAENAEIATLTVRRGMRRAFDWRRAAAKLGLELDDAVERQATDAAVELDATEGPCARLSAGAARSPSFAAGSGRSRLSALVSSLPFSRRRELGESEADVQVALYGDPRRRRQERQTDKRRLRPLG